MSRHRPLFAVTICYDDEKLVSPVFVTGRRQQSQRHKANRMYCPQQHDTRYVNERFRSTSFHGKLNSFKTVTAHMNPISNLYCFASWLHDPSYIRCYYSSSFIDRSIYGLAIFHHIALRHDLGSLMLNLFSNVFFRNIKGRPLRLQVAKHEILLSGEFLLAYY